MHAAHLSRLTSSAASTGRTLPTAPACPTQLLSVCEPSLARWHAIAMSACKCSRNRLLPAQDRSGAALTAARLTGTAVGAAMSQPLLAPWGCRRNIVC